MRVAFLLVAAFVTAASSAIAAPGDDRTTCFSTGSDDYKRAEFIEVGLRACHRLITSGKFSGTGLANLLRARGYWNHQKKDLDAALADFNRAIQLDPKHVEGYDYRADVWTDKGELDRAIADHDMAIRIDPTYAAAYYTRGRVYETKGQIDRAVADYNAALSAPARDRTGEWAHRGARTRLQELKR